MSLGESGLPDVNQRDGKAFITEGPDDGELMLLREGIVLTLIWLVPAKNVQFFDTPKPRRPAPPNKHQDKCATLPCPAAPV